MAVGYTTWTVLKHDPIDKFEDNLWHVSGYMERGNERKMVVGKRDNGELVLFNVVALGEAEMAELEAFGTPKWMVVPNGFHRQDAYIWKQRYPGLQVVAPKAAAAAVAKAVPVDLTCDEFPSGDRVQVLHPAGMGDKEAIMIVRHGHGQTLTTCDAILNLPSSKLKFPISVLMAPTDTVSTPRLIRWMMMKNKAAWIDHLQDLAKTTTRLIPGHGAVVHDGAAGLRTVLGHLS